MLHNYSFLIVLFVFIVLTVSLVLMGLIIYMEVVVFNVFVISILSQKQNVFVLV